MNIYEAVESIIALQKTSISYLVDSIGYKTAIAEILEELLDTGGVSDEYSEIKRLRVIISQHHSADVSRLSPGEACPVCQKYLEVEK